MVYKKNAMKMVETAPAFPLGVSLKNGVLTAAVSVPGASGCRILLREYVRENPTAEEKLKEADKSIAGQKNKDDRKGCTGKDEKIQSEACKLSEYRPWEVYELLPAPVFTGIYTGSIKVDPSKKYEYIFENEEGYFLDDRAVKINHNDKFGGFLGTYPEKPDSDVAKILEDTMGLTCMAESESFDWGNDCQPDRAYSELILYKLHVRGFTVHGSSGVKHPGTYKGVLEKIPYLQRLGVNGIIIQPCVEFNEFMDYGINIGADIVQDVFRSRFRPYANRIMDSRINFWGYGAQSFYFAPKASFASEPDNACSEMKEMVKALHHAGIEVIMEMDFGKCNEPSFVLDSLIYWVREYHIDGFRVNAGQVPMSLIVSNPYLCNVKLISQSLDEDVFKHVKPGNRHHLAVANDAFQNTMRRFVKGDEGQLKYVSDLISKNPTEPAVINFMADHDGFTLNDVYSYDERHNERNGERNRDGRDMNYSWNCGIEGPTKKRRIQDLRMKMIKNAMGSLFLSAGTPMLMAGDEFGNTHEGNNNPYCCDNEQGWVIWDRSKRAVELRSFCEHLINLRKNCGILHRDENFSGRDPLMKGLPDISFHGIKAWSPDFSYYSRTLCILFNGAYADDSFGKAGNKVSVANEKSENAVRKILGTLNNDNNEQSDCPENSDICVIFNMHWDEHEFGLPAVDCISWKQELASCQISEGIEEIYQEAKNDSLAEEAQQASNDVCPDGVQENQAAVTKEALNEDVQVNQATVTEDASTEAVQNIQASVKKDVLPEGVSENRETVKKSLAEVQKSLTAIKVPPRSVVILRGIRR